MPSILLINIHKNQRNKTTENIINFYFRRLENILLGLLFIVGLEEGKGVNLKSKQSKSYYRQYIDNIRGINIIL